MSQKWSFIFPGVIIALLLLPAAAVASGGGTYITATGDAQEYKNLCIDTVDALDPLDVEITLVTLESTETGDLKALEYPLFGDVTREFDPASGTYHGAHVDVAAETTVDGSTLPCYYQAYIKRTIPTFTVEVPGRFGNVLLVKCPENEAASKEGYLFKSDAIIYMNQTGFTAYGTISSTDYDEDDLAYTLNHNEVDLTCFSTDSNLARNMMDARPYTRPEAGEYLIAAVEYDGATDTMHVLAAMPVLILDGNPAVTWDGDDPYYQDLGGDATISFSGVDKIAYVLVREETRYGLSMTVSAVDLVDILRTIAGEAGPVAYEAGPVAYTLTCDGVPTDVSSGSGFVIAEGYGCSGYAEASSMTVPAATLHDLNPGTYSLYALGMEDEKVVALDQTDVCIFAVAPTPTPTHTPTPKPTGGGGGGGGGGSGSFFPPEPPIVYEQKGNLATDSTGVVTRSVIINAEDNVSSLFVPSGVKALDANGNPLIDVSIRPITNDTVPAVPAGALFRFAGYAYEVSPNGATFEPGISLTLQIPEEAWKTLDLNGQKLSVKWYNKGTGGWEEIQTTVSPGTRTVKATITHFSVYALFTEPVSTTTPTEAATTTTTTPPVEEPPAEGLSLTTILFAIVVIVIIAAAGYFFMTKK